MRYFLKQNWHMSNSTSQVSWPSKFKKKLEQNFFLTKRKQPITFLWHQYKWIQFHEHLYIRTTSMLIVYTAHLMVTYLNMDITALVVWRLSCLATLSTSCESRATCKYAATLRARTARCVPPALRDVLGLYVWVGVDGWVCMCVGVK